MTTTNNTTATVNTSDNTVFNVAKYTQYLRNASTQREQLITDIYNDTNTLDDFILGCEQVALRFATSTGVNIQTIGMLSTIGKIPKKSLFRMVEVSQEKFKETGKDSIALLFAKLVIPYTTALTVVLKYANVVDK